LKDVVGYGDGGFHTKSITVRKPFDKLPLTRADMESSRTVYAPIRASISNALALSGD
jgi:hypothetical protein